MALCCVLVSWCPGVHCARVVTELSAPYTAPISYCLCSFPLQFGGARVVEGETAVLVGTRRSPLPRVTSPALDAWLFPQCFVLVHNTER